MQYHLVAQDPKYSAEQPRVRGLVPGKLELAEFTSSCRFVTEQKAVEGGFLLQAQGDLQVAVRLSWGQLVLNETNSV